MNLKFECNKLNKIASIHQVEFSRCKKLKNPA